MKIQDFTGQKIGRLTVLERVGSSCPPKWRCVCECGKECVKSSTFLRSSEVPSCGCYTSEVTSKSRLDDITGKRYGRLTVIKRVPSNGLTKWLCRCDCGNEIEALGNNLKRGHTISCGCYRDESRVKVKTIHGYTHTRAYGVWSKIKGRCYQKNNPSYPRYGGRGIGMCDEWRDNPEAFIKWAYENGYRDDAKYGECTVDRIDNNKGYSPDNCRIANEKTQANNRRTNRYIEHNGESKTMAQWSDIYDLNPMTVRYYHVDRGMTLQEILDKGLAKNK